MGVCFSALTVMPTVAPAECASLPGQVIRKKKLRSCTLLPECLQSCHAHFPAERECCKNVHFEREPRPNLIRCLCRNYVFCHAMIFV